MTNASYKLKRNFIAAGYFPRRSKRFKRRELENNNKLICEEKKVEKDLYIYKEGREMWINTVTIQGIRSRSK
jgi:hypothetical protein